jgi:hypothetical protein
MLWFLQWRPWGIFTPLETAQRCSQVGRLPAVTPAVPRGWVRLVPARSSPLCKDTLSILGKIPLALHSYALHFGSIDNFEVVASCNGHGKILIAL